MVMERIKRRLYS